MAEEKEKYLYINTEQMNNKKAAYIGLIKGLCTLLIL